ncbi:uncharacterized protein HMPREF1541_03339 [Cyphellophora europaea CBS 101466]|uniref:Transcription factor domain-containing protein n=1 Tax=Cyphellophora europaea (strain CBS 101466) TaxID=1220924 RepID=W2S0F5_CYPE1|nr:uncharacterized protein HMPREF1541_03339 [Cyphellophora europaea CBS 101466]ETN41404.1 hypothetical protein HMPREF1541_03339 [Cyphellophora europaea CBS 101466]
MPAATNYRFINSYSGNGSKPSKDARRDVRSYVARVSHTAGTKDKVTRLKGDKHRSTVVCKSGLAVATHTSPGAMPNHDHKLDQVWVIQLLADLVVVDVEITSLQDEDDDDSPPKRKLLVSNRPPPAHTDVVARCQHESQLQYPPSSKNITARPFASPVHILSSHTSTPISHLAVYHKPYIAAVLHNYVTKLALPIPEIDNNSPRPLLRTVWLPMVMQNAAIFQVIALFAAAHWATYAEPARHAALYSEILALKQSALQGLLSGLRLANAHLDSAKSAGGGNARGKLSNGEEECLIAAIAKMASYEAIFGDPASYHTHMNAASRLLRARGGLASLGMDGMLSRLLRFIDTNSAFLLGTHLYLEHDQGVGVCLPRHMPFRLKRFDDDVGAQQGVRRGDVADANAKVEEMGRREVQGLGTVNVQRFVGWCGTEDGSTF